VGVKGILLVAVTIAVAAPDARAKPADDDNFWAAMIAPNAEEIELVLAKARELRQSAMQFTLGPDLGYPNPYNDSQTEQRRARFADAFGMLRYARRELDPNHLDVLYELGRAAEDIGRYDDAVDALSAFVDRAGDKDRRLAEVHIRLGRLSARRGEWDTTLAELRAALARPGSGLSGQALIYLGCAYMQTDHMAEAIDTLDQASATSPYGQLYYLAQTAQFALAVAYDRDEQITRSHEVLERLLAGDPGLNNALGQPYYDYTGNGLDSEPLLWPPSERHYFLALRYEALNMLDEARGEWSAFLRAAEDSPFHARAQAHVDAIDRLRDEQMRTDEQKTKPAQPQIHILRGPIP